MSLVDATGPIKYAVINQSAAASNEIVAAVTNRNIRIIGITLVAAGAVSVTIEDEDGVDLIGLIALAANQHYVLPVHGLGYQQTARGKALHMLLGGAVQVGGSITYQEAEAD